MSKTLFGLQNADGTFIFEEVQRFQHTHQVDASWPPDPVIPMICTHPSAHQVDGIYLCDVCNAQVSPTGFTPV